MHVFGLDSLALVSSMKAQGNDTSVSEWSLSACRVRFNAF